MAFFRCGGSGIPASLKSGMNSVLNKKFGTSTTYDPAGWPADVNLLGPLPIKSASGAIASFSDGADGVPVKSCVVSFLPSGGGGTPSAPVAIVGHSGITLTNKDNMSTPTHTDTYTDTFGQTIYGGTRDLTTDKASVTWHRVKISDLSFVKDANCQHTFRCSGMISPYNRKYGNGNFNIKAEVFATYTAQHSTGSNIATLETGHDFNIFINGGSNTFYISCDSSYDSKTATGFTTDFGDVYLYYELATPTEITGLTPHAIDTLYGDNNIYADTGTTTVEYRADIDLALNA